MFLLIGLPVFVAGQQTALKTNALFWATTTPNIGVEVGISHNITIELWGAYNAWKYPDDMKLNFADLITVVEAAVSVISGDTDTSGEH